MITVKLEFNELELISFIETMKEGVKKMFLSKYRITILKNIIDLLEYELWKVKFDLLTSNMEKVSCLQQIN